MLVGNPKHTTGADKNTVLGFSEILRKSVLLKSKIDKKIIMSTKNSGADKKLL
ncbi:hypothetical protein Desal_3499 [Maridesulfovibrio salexigens DSM 2638]|uniref:Uncharacterized protein n=1 Tax=Maridesulfovibrio salexigens (strain ATCC 14822 / DSM 2638 / NCIMB 8403 / VKM B-1763) TaxID=526222 RepID=C6BST9_MARSD|nr:hypothetical protein Desal_3499 [Maridesulfovibrio salexigens DSM 2638]